MTGPRTSSLLPSIRKKIYKSGRNHRALPGASWLIIEVMGGSDHSPLVKKSGNEAKRQRMSLACSRSLRRGEGWMGVERRLKGSGSKETVGMSELVIYQWNGRAQSRSVIIFTKNFPCRTLCPSVSFRFPVPVGGSVLSDPQIYRSPQKKSIGPLPHLSEKDIPPIALTQPHFIPPLFFLSLLAPARLSPLRPPVPPVDLACAWASDAELRQCTVLRHPAF